MNVTEYLTNGLNLSKAQVEAITQLSEACGMVDLFEGASPFGKMLSNIKAYQEKQAKKEADRANKVTVTSPVPGDESLFDTGEDAELDDLITPEGNAIGLANAGFQYGEEADSESDSTLSNFGKSEIKTFNKNVNREEQMGAGVDDDDEIDVAGVSDLMKVVKRMAECTHMTKADKVKRLMQDAASADQSVTADKDSSESLDADGDSLGKADSDAVTIQKLADMVKQIVPQCHSMPSDDTEELRELREMVTKLVKNHNTPFVQMVGFDKLAIENGNAATDNTDQLTSILGGATGLDPNAKVGSSKDYHRQQFGGRRRITGSISR